jgi:hypothetical protein
MTDLDTEPQLFTLPPGSPPLPLSARFTSLATEKGTFTALAGGRRLPCDECVWLLHEAAGRGDPPRTARKEYRGSHTVRLCPEHTDLWKSRVPPDAKAPQPTRPVATAASFDQEGALW